MLTVEPEVIEAYVRTGKVQLVFRDVLNHGERSERTSEAAASAGQQGQFWPMHALLFEEQPTVWATSNDGLIGLMLGYAARLPGLDQATFAQSLQERAMLATLKATDAEQRKRGITSQPIFEIGTQRLAGLQSFEVMQRAIEAALKV